MKYHIIYISHKNNFTTYPKITMEIEKTILQKYIPNQLTKLYTNNLTDLKEELKSTKLSKNQKEIYIISLHKTIPYKDIERIITDNLPNNIQTYSLPLGKVYIAKNICIALLYDIPYIAKENLEKCLSIIEEKFLTEEITLELVFYEAYKPEIQTFIENTNLPIKEATFQRIGDTTYTYLKIDKLHQDKITYIKSKFKEKFGYHFISPPHKNLLEEVSFLLKQKNKTVSVAESCTGGGLGYHLTKISGSSSYFVGGIISYSNEMKQKILGIKEETLKKWGAVSEQTATEMATNLKKITNTDIAIAITGIAGPTGGTPQKPIGLVYIGYYMGEKIYVQKNLFSGDRDTIRLRAIEKALFEIKKFLMN